MGVVASAASMASAGLLAASLMSCAALQAIEPVIAPPTQFQLDRAVEVEFRDASVVGVRCAERGATFLGLPGLNLGACSDRSLITMPDPCGDSGAYGAALCAYLEQVRAVGGLQRIGLADWEASTVTIAFVHPALISGRCAAAGWAMAGVEGTEGCLGAGALIIANPCVVEQSGWFVELLCHELAHANGWPVDHAGGSYARQPSFVKRDLAAEDVLPPEKVRALLAAKSR